MRTTADMGMGGYSKIDKKVIEMMKRDLVGINLKDINIIGVFQELEVIKENYERANKYFDDLMAYKKKEIDKKYEEDVKNARDTGFIQKANDDRVRAYLALSVTDPEIREAKKELSELERQKEKLEMTIKAFTEEYSDTIEEAKKEILKQDIIKAAGFFR